MKRVGLFAALAIVLLSGCVKPENFEITDPIANPDPTLQMTFLAKDIAAMKSEYSELSDFEFELPLKQPRLFYRYKVTHVESPLSESVKKYAYDLIDNGGCYFSIQFFPPGKDLWQGLSTGPDIESIHWMLHDGSNLMATIQTKNSVLRSVIRGKISEYFGPTIWAGEKISEQNNTELSQ